MRILKECSDENQTRQRKDRVWPGVEIKLTGSEVATAIDAYLVAHGVYASGARTITVNGKLCETGRVYVDPSGFVLTDGKRYTGRGNIE